MSIRQGTQVLNSNVYDDTVVPSAAMEPAISTSNLAVDLDNVRSMINEIVSNQGGNWYDPLADRDLNTTSADLLALEERPVTCNASVLTQFTVTAAQNWQILSVAGSEAPSLGGSQSNAVQGVIVATSSLSGAGFNVHELVERASTGDGSALSPLNLAVVVGTDGQPIQSGGTDVLALVQVESTFTPDGGAFNDVSAGNRVKLSFVIANAGRTDLIACPVVDIAGVTISYNYLFNQLLENLDPSCFTGSRGFVDQAADVGVTLSAAISGQGAGAFIAANNINWGLTDGDFLDIEDSAAATLLRVTGDVAGSGSTVLFGGDTDVFDNNAVVNDFVAGATMGSGLASSVNVAVASGLIEATGALTLESNGADATLLSTAGGAVVLNSAVNVNIDADTVITLDTADDTDASAKGITLTSASSTAGAAAGAPVDINTGTGFGAGQGGIFGVTLGIGGATGVAGYMDVTHAGDDDERIAQYSVTGTGADQVGIFVGSSSPDARVNAGGDIGSLFVDGTNAALWINTDGTTAWSEFGISGATLLSAAVAAQAGTAFTAGAFNTQWGMTDGQFFELGDSANLGIFTVSALAAGNEVTLAANLTATGETTSGGVSHLLTGGAGAAATNAGGGVDSIGGAGNTTGTGGASRSIGGAGGVTGVGGVGSVAGGAGGATSGNGGAATMDGGAAIDGSGGAASVTGGAGGTTLGNAPGSASLIGGAAGAGSASSGATAFVTGGAPDGVGAGGAVNVSASGAIAVNGSGGSATLAAGGNLFLSNGGGGATSVSAGNAQGATFAAGAVTVSAGGGASGALGGDVNVFGGGSDASGETLNGAGSIFLTAGNNSGTDRSGDIGVTAGTAFSAGGEGGRSIYTGGTSTGAIDAPIFQLIPGVGGATGANGFIHINAGNDGDEAVFRMSASGTSGDGASMFVGSLDPSAGGGVAAEEASTYYRDTGAGAGEMYLKTGTLDTDWSLVQTGTGDTSLSEAITLETAANFIATNGTSWGLADTDSFALTGPAGAGDEIFDVNALAAGNTVNINADTIIQGNDGNGLNSIQLLAGAGVAATNGGTGVRLVGGQGNTTGVGGTLSGAAGGGGATGAGGPLIWDSGDGGATSGNSGDVDISTGTVTDGDTGTITLNVENAVGVGNGGGDVVLDAGDSPDSVVGGNVVLRTGDSGTSDAGFVHFDTPNDDDEHWGQVTTGGTNGTVVQLLAGVNNPDGVVAAFGGSLYQRRVDAASGSALFVNDSTAAGEGTSWAEVLHENSRSIGQGIASGTIAANTDISNLAAASNVTMDFGTFPTIPSTQAEMDVRTKVYVNGILQRSGVVVVRTGTQATAIQLTFGLVLGDVITVEQWST